VEIDLQRFYRVNRPILMWIVFFLCLYLLRQFFALMFITYIFAFVMRNVARFLTAKTRAPYWAAVVFPYLVALTLLVLLMVTTIPRVAEEATEFGRKVPGLLQELAREAQKSAKTYGLEPMLAKYVNTAIDQAPATQTMDPGPPASSSDTINLPAMVKTLQQLALSLLPGMQSSDQGGNIISLLDRFIGGAVSGVLKFLLAILLSFLIVLDFEAIGAQLNKWQESQVGRFFHEAAASVIDFSGVVGRAFQCQVVVAFLNASITCVGMFVLGIQPLLLLTTIVFLCGLIPVLGVFISSVPIILIAFNSPGGLKLALLALGVIVVVHLLEAYVFNPRIYAARFHLNPVIVLIILFVAHELFGVWGMLLGIPVTTYVLNIAQMPSLPPPKQRIRKTKDANSAPA
jgi:predicted PurR-regulated permease PerM